MKTIVISNLKGGVGKTTTTVNLAYSLSQLQKKVLVIDLDPQCNCTRFFAKVNPLGHNIRDILKDVPKLYPYHTKYQNIHIVRGSENITCENSFALKEAFETLKETYDYCLIDTRPVFDILTQNAFCVADIILTPIKFDSFCRDNLALVENFMTNYENNDHFEWKVFANFVANAKAQRKTMRDILEKHSYPIMDTCITRSTVVDNSLSLYKPVRLHRKKSSVSEDYMELAKELMR